MKKYYFDTSIWLDFFENRDEPNLPKGEWANKLVDRIISEDSKIVYSDAVKDEITDLGYIPNDVEKLFEPLNRILIFAEATKKQFGKAKDLAAKRNVPLFYALHALIARDNKALMITRETHFKKLSDIAKYKKPEDII